MDNPGVWAALQRTKWDPVENGKIALHLTLKNALTFLCSKTPLISN